MPRRPTSKRPGAFNAHNPGDGGSGLVQPVFRSPARIPSAESTRKGLCAAPPSEKRYTFKRKTLYVQAKNAIRYHARREWSLFRNARSLPQAGAWHIRITLLGIAAAYSRRCERQFYPRAYCLALPRRFHRGGETIRSE